YMDLDGLCYTWNNSQNATGYIWDFGDGSPVYTTFSPVHVYTAPGTYTITLTAYNYNCTTSTTGTVVVIEKHDIGTPAHQIPGLLRVFPNPFEGKLRLEWLSDSEDFFQESVSITLTAVSGERVYSARWQSNTLIIPTSDLPVGIYILEVRRNTATPVRLKVLKL
ncbi:MAG: PKD domain-containing protein, partial [Flavobacteriales bacterium]|nr:PKD domain-containing protein [Flavobacteriales bacterium]MDW8410892.1 PKD domain-containing protein [Flavobacteriales bacterium]